MDEVKAVEEAIALADTLLREALANTTRRERRQLHRLGRLVADPPGRELVQRLTDDVLRIPSNRRAARRFADVVGALGLPPSLGATDRALLSTGARPAPPRPPPRPGNSPNRHAPRTPTHSRRNERRRPAGRGPTVRRARRRAP